MRASRAPLIISSILIAGAMNAALASEGDMANLCVDFIDKSKDADSEILTRTIYSKTADQCEAAYYAGDMKTAESSFKKLILQMKQCQSLVSLIKQVHGRVVMLSKEDTMPKCASVCMYESMLSVIEKTLGPKHKFVSDVLKYIAEYYESNKNVRKGMALRMRQWTITAAAYGRDSLKVQQVKENVAYDYYLLGDYKNAQQLIGECISTCSKKGYREEDVNARQLDRMIKIAAARKHGKSKS